MHSKNSFSMRILPDLGLLGIAVLWGLSFPLIRMGLSEMSPLSFVAYRFILAAIVFLPFICFNKFLRSEVKRALPVGLALGVIASGLFITQTIGLQTVSSPRAAFITGAYVFIVPLLSPLFKSKVPSKYDWGAVVVALAGLFLLINPETEGASFGDLLILCCALLVAIHIHILQRVSKNNYHPMALAFLQICGVAISSAFVALPLSSTHSLPFGIGGWLGLVLCALLVTNLTFWLQAKFQKHSTPQRTALIFSSEPIFATVFGYFMLGETLSLRAMLGGLILLGSLLISKGFLFPSGVLQKY